MVTATSTEAPMVVVDIPALADVGARVVGTGAAVGDPRGELNCCAVVGRADGFAVGVADGFAVGIAVGTLVGDRVGGFVGFFVGEAVGLADARKECHTSMA
jgi:phage tail tape-measure protein